MSKKVVPLNSQWFIICYLYPHVSKTFIQTALFSKHSFKGQTQIDPNRPLSVKPQPRNVAPIPWKWLRNPVDETWWDPLHQTWLGNGFLYGKSHYPLVICYIAIENGPFIVIVDLPMNSMVIFHSFLYVYQRVSTEEFRARFDYQMVIMNGMIKSCWW